MADSGSNGSNSSSVSGNGGDDSGAASNWWGSWVSSAKAKSSSVLEAVRKDLDELSTAVRTEVSNAGTVIGDTFKIDDPTVGQVKKSLSSFFGQVTEALIPSLDDDQDQAEAVLITTDGQITLTGFQKHLAELQSADETYLTAPAASLHENYVRWLEVTEQDQFTQSRLAKHLTSSEILNEKYLALVPDSCAHMDFWQRYLFRRALLEDALANAELAERRARAEAAVAGCDGSGTATPSVVKLLEQTEQTEQPKEVGDGGNVVEGVELAAEATGVKEATQLDEADQLEAVFGGRHRDVDGAKAGRWPEETDFASVEISEEEQERLLRAYEEEIQEREMKRNQCVPLEEKLRLDKEQIAESTTVQSMKTSVGLAKKPANTSSTTKKISPSEAKQRNADTKSSQNKITVNTKAQQRAVAAGSSNRSNNKNSEVASRVVAAPGTKSTTSGVAGEPRTKEDDAGSDESWVKDFDLEDSNKIQP